MKKFLIKLKEWFFAPSNADLLRAEVRLLTLRVNETSEALRSILNVSKDLLLTVTDQQKRLEQLYKTIYGSPNEIESLDGEDVVFVDEETDKNKLN